MLRSIQRFGRLGKRSAGDLTAVEGTGRGGDGCGATPASGGGVVPEKSMKVRGHMAA